MKRFHVFIDDDSRPFLGTDDVALASTQAHDIIACNRYRRVRVVDNLTGRIIETTIDRRTQTRTFKLHDDLSAAI